MSKPIVPVLSVKSSGQTLVNSIISACSFEEVPERFRPYEQKGVNI